MPIPQLPGSLNSIDDIKNYIMRLERELRFLMESGLDSTNAFEFGGWRVKPDQIISKDGDVGMSTLDDGADPIRFWAGDARLAAPNFTVTRAGLLTATGALIRSAATGYPRIELNGIAGLLAAYHTATDYIAIDPDATGNATLIFENGLTSVLVSAIGATYAINAILGNISINAQSGDLFLSAGGGAYKVKFVDWNEIYSIGDLQTLQQILDSKQGAITSGDVTVVAGVATLGNNINTTHLANGNVSNTEFQYLDGVTSAIQTQLNTKPTNVIKQGSGTTGTELSSGPFFYATLTISFTGFTSIPKISASNGSTLGAWITAITNVTTTGADIFLTSTQTGFVASKTINWTAIGT